ncbi:unnamed protein product [Agarophyton chilense]
MNTMDTTNSFTAPISSPVVNKSMENNESDKKVAAEPDRKTAATHAIHNQSLQDDTLNGTQDRLQVISTVSRNMPVDVILTMKMFTKAIEDIGMQLLRLAVEWDKGIYARQYQYAKYQQPIELPRRIVSLPEDEAFSSGKIGALVTRSHTFLRAQMPLVARLATSPNEVLANPAQDTFRAFFGKEDLFPMPKGVISSEKSFWKEDSTFSAQFLNGCNPTIIERVTCMNIVYERMPTEFLGLSDPEGRTVQQLVEQKALYWADYEVLHRAAQQGGIQLHESGSFVNPINFEKIGMSSKPMLKHFYAPFVAFYGKSDGQLGVLGIMLTRHKDGRKNEVYNQKTCIGAPNTYIFAKMHVACADNQMHQFYSHLGRCHLVFEPFGVAVRNVFKFGSSEAQNHIVGKLLDAHFRDHIAINWLARNTLVAHGDDAIPFTDAGFALGSKCGLLLFGMKYSKWTLSDQAFPQQLRNRGFDPDQKDNLEYFYRDDGIMIWNALSEYVEKAIKVWYNKSGESPLNQAIADDEVLKLWCSEMRDPGRAAVSSFPKTFIDWKQLCETITTIMYNVSAEHSAVNASQERYLSYVPNRPNSLFQPVRSPSEADMDLDEEILMLHRARGDDDDIGCSMPLAFAVFQVQFAQLLTSQPMHTMLEIEGEGVPTEAVTLLKSRLQHAHEVIRSRNERLEGERPDMAPYEFLDPALVAQSIEI